MSEIKKVFLFTGHMIDQPGRPKPRFPASKESLANWVITTKLKEFNAQPQDIAISSAACGGDILFAEACLAIGMNMTIYLPLQKDKFIGSSVSGGGENWVARFEKVIDHSKVTVSYLPDDFYNTEEYNVYERTNILMLEKALSHRDHSLHVLLLWDGERGDGPGGTAGMVEKLKNEKIPYYTINPHNLTLLKKLKKPGPKRILALDGGGIRGAISLGYLEKIEAILKERHGNDEKFRLSDYYDLIGGTSTGAIIASALAIGLSASEIKDLYLELGGKIFGKKELKKWYMFWKYKERLKAEFDEGPLKESLHKIFKGYDLGSGNIKTGLCIVTKRADTQSTWPLINHPEARYYEDNKGFPLENVIRASTAAPTYFIPEAFAVKKDGSGPGAFVDGGVSMDNNPALRLFLIAILNGFPFRWETGEQKLLITSVGTGYSDGKKSPEQVLNSKLWNWASEIPNMLMQDASWHNQVILQLLSNSKTPWFIDREIGDLSNDLLEKPFITYQRYNVRLEEDGLKELKLEKLLKTPGVKSLQEMSNAENRDVLAEIGKISGEMKIMEDHFPAAFDLK